MNVKRVTTALIILIVGAAIAVASFNEVKLVLKGDKLDFNTASQSDFDEKHLVEGEICFAYGPFATYEEEHKTYGITTSKKETNYYIVGSFTKDDMWGDDSFFTIFSTADKDMIKKLDNASEKWVSYLNSMDEDELPPEISIKFEGKLWTEPTDSKYEKFRNEAFDDMKNIGVDKSMYSKLKINEGEVGTSSIIVFALGVVAAIVGILLLVVPFIKARKKSNEEFY